MSETSPEKAIPEGILNGAFLFQLSSLTRNALPEGYGGQMSFEEALFAWAETQISGEMLDLFRSVFSVETLKKSFEDGKASITFDYDDPADEKTAHRLVTHLLTDEDNGEVLCVSALKSFPRETAGSEGADSAPFRAVIRSYRLFFAVNPEMPQVMKSAVYLDRDGVAVTLTMPCPYRTFLKAVADRYVRAAWADEFLGTFRMESIREAMERGQAILTHTFSSDEGPLRMDVYLPDGGSEDKRCYFGLGGADEADGKGLAVSRQDGEAMHAAFEDLQLSMQMERDETRKKHRRRSFLLVLLTVIVGLAGGSVLMQRIPEYSAVFDRFFPVATEAVPTETPPPPEEVEIVVPDTVKEYIPFMQSREVKADLMENGLPSTSAGFDKDETVTASFAVAELMTPEWFEAQYGKAGYALDGTEAGVHLKFSFTESEKHSSLVPQEAFPMRIADAEGNTVAGYQLMDAPIGGKYNFKTEAGTEADLYKRCDSLENAKYLVVSCWRDGVPHEYWFSLRYDDPNVEHETLQKGSKGEEVAVMKKKLAELGFMSEKAAAANASYTDEAVKAVKAAQEAFGLEVTGIADSEFLKALYSR